MTPTKSRRIFIWLSFVVGVIITSETYLLPTHQQTEVLDNGTTDKSRARNSSWYTYFFLTKAGNKYKVPEYLYNAVLIGETFQVHKTLVCRRPVRLSWCRKDGRCFTVNTGTLNNNYFGYAAMAYLIIYPLLVMLGILKINTSGKQTNVYICFTIALGTLAFYLIY